MNDNCFAYVNNGCGVLNTTLCKNGSCPFYKSKKRYEEDKKKYPCIKAQEEKKKIEKRKEAER